VWGHAFKIGNGLLWKVIDTPPLDRRSESFERAKNSHRAR
jgi:hypothetical protein